MGKLASTSTLDAGALALRQHGKGIRSDDSLLAARLRLNKR
ncbi:MAG: hypothetical protein OXU20_29150 [Myxococcales bacterium]|nr:hypothetical protein [Myxococcales bacterium]